MVKNKKLFYWLHISLAFVSLSSFGIAIYLLTFIGKYDDNVRDWLPVAMFVLLCPYCFLLVEIMLITHRNGFYKKVANFYGFGFIISLVVYVLVCVIVRVDMADSLKFVLMVVCGVLVASFWELNIAALVKSQREFIKIQKNQ